LSRESKPISWQKNPISWQKNPISWLKIKFWQKYQISWRKIQLVTNINFSRFLISDEIARKMRKSRFPTFGFVFTDFELWEVFKGSFWCFWFWVSYIETWIFQNISAFHFTSTETQSRKHDSRKSKERSFERESFKALHYN